MSPLNRTLLGVLSFLPAAGVLGLAIVAVVSTHDRLDHELDVGPLVVTVPGFTLDEAIAIGTATVVVAFIQIGVAIPLIVHAQKNDRLPAAMRLAWSLLVVFVGSICAPLYWTTQIRPHAG